MKTANTHYLLALGIAVATVLFLILVIGAVGIIGAGGRPDRMYLAVLAVLAVGSVLARLRPRGMALALLATALTQVLVTVIALTAVVAGAQDFKGASVVDILGINAMYAALFSLSAWLFQRAAEQPSAVPVRGGA